MFFKTIKDVLAHVPLLLPLAPAICSNTLFISFLQSWERRAFVTLIIYLLLGTLALTPPLCEPFFYFYF